MRPGGIVLTSHMLEEARLCPGARILDIGCGRGRSVAWLCGQGFDAAGIDCSASLAADGRRSCPGIRLQTADARALPFETGSCDGVLAECVLSLIPGKQVMDEIRRVLKPAGILMVSDLYDVGGQRQDVSEMGWRRRMETAGFEVRYFEDQTPALKSFAAQLIWEGKSLSGLRECAGCRLPEKPGYFTLVAARRRDD